MWRLGGGLSTARYVTFWIYDGFLHKPVVSSCLLRRSSAGGRAQHFHMQKGAAAHKKYLITGPNEKMRFGHSFGLPVTG